MSITDPIADMLSSIKNACMVRAETVDIRHSKMKVEIAKILKDEGFISGIEEHIKQNRKVIGLRLKYSPDKKSLISELKRISRPGRRTYVSYEDIPMIKRGFGLTVLSTSKGLMVGSEARRLKLGGELLCYVW